MTHACPGSTLCYAAIDCRGMSLDAPGFPFPSLLFILLPSMLPFVDNITAIVRDAAIVRRAVGSSPSMQVWFSASLHLWDNGVGSGPVLALLLLFRDYFCCWFGFSCAKLFFDPFPLTQGKLSLLFLKPSKDIGTSTVQNEEYGAWPSQCVKCLEIIFVVERCYVNNTELTWLRGALQWCTCIATG